MILGVETSYNSTMNSNQGYNQSLALQLRLDAKQLIEDIELFLRGSVIIATRDEKTGRIKTETVPRGRPHANALGIQSLLNEVSSKVNPQVVQGNFATDTPGHSSQYERYIIRVHKNLSHNLMNNLYNWEISEDDYDVIIDFIMDLIEPFMTRLIDNKERESYETTVRHNEVTKMSDIRG